jgi:hypothetical protein
MLLWPISGLELRCWLERGCGLLRLRRSIGGCNDRVLLANVVGASDALSSHSRTRSSGHAVLDAIVRDMRVAAHPPPPPGRYFREA